MDHERNNGRDEKNDDDKSEDSDIARDLRDVPLLDGVRLDDDEGGEGGDELVVQRQG